MNFTNIFFNFFFQINITISFLHVNELQSLNYAVCAKMIKKSNTIAITQIDELQLPGDSYASKCTYFATLSCGGTVIL